MAGDDRSTQEHEQGVRETLARHDAVIENVVKSVDNLTAAIVKTDDKLDLVVEAIGQNAVILERIANMDEAHRDSINRVHKRVDETNKQVDEKASKLHLEKVAEQARKGELIYNIIIAVSIGIPVLATLFAGLLWVIDNYSKAPK